MKKINIIGNVYGKLKVLSEDPNTTIKAIVQCDCGRIKIVITAQLNQIL